MVVAKVDALLLATTAQHEKRGDGQQHTRPLPAIEPLAKDEQGTHKHHYGASGIDRADDGQRQMLHAEVAQHPAGQHDERLQHDISVYLPATRGHMEDRAVEHVSACAQHDKGQEDERREECVQKQHGYDGVLFQCLLLKRIVAA